MYEIPGFKLGTLKAKADYSAKQYYALKVDNAADNQAVLAGAGESAIGILLNKPILGEVCEIVCDGVVPAKLGDTVTRGDELMVKSDGTLIPHTSTNSKIGVALESGVVGDIIPVLLLTRSGIGSSSNYSIINLPIALSKIADGDIVTEFVPGFAGTIEKFFAIVTDPATTAAKAATLNLEIESTNVTGGVLSLTSANMTPLGKTVDATAITAAKTFTATQKISVEASSTTAFIEGSIVLCIVIKNS